VVPEKCSKGGPKQGSKAWVSLCRQPFHNETTSKTQRVNTPEETCLTPRASLSTTQQTHHSSCDTCILLASLQFDRAGWLLQQFIKLGVTPREVPGIGEAYMVVDADTIFYQDYHPFPRTSASLSAASAAPATPASDVKARHPSAAHSAQLPQGLLGMAQRRLLNASLPYNYIPGDPRDCGNPPYFMTMAALGIRDWTTTTLACAGRGFLTVALCRTRTVRCKV